MESAAERPRARAIHRDRPGSGPNRLIAAALCIVLPVMLAGCGGGSSTSASGTGASQTIAGAAANVATLVVDSGPAGLPADEADIDTPFVTVTICAPGSTTNCQSIDHVEVDTGSSGLRILASVLNASLYAVLPQVNESTSGSPLAECTVFADGYSWGPVKTAGLQISSESASSIEVQLIGDPAYPDADTPQDCTGTGGEEDTVATFGANGIIGLGPLAQDCGSGCSSGVQSAWYYVCPTSSTCSDHTVSLAQQVTNPVVFFPTDNNGTIVELPAIPAAGAATASGALVFGIGTEGNNDLGSATVMTVDDVYGELTTDFGGGALSQSFLDTGSNGFFFNDSSIAACTDISGWYCPSTTLSLSATNLGLNGATSAVSFSVENLDTLGNDNPSYVAFNDLGGPNSLPDSFDWGLPFFFGRNVYTAIAGQTTAAGTGPYFAY